MPPGVCSFEGALTAVVTGVVVPTRGVSRRPDENTLVIAIPGRRLRPTVAFGILGSDFLVCSLRFR